MALVLGLFSNDPDPSRRHCHGGNTGSQAFTSTVFSLGLLQVTGCSRKHACHLYVTCCVVEGEKIRYYGMCPCLHQYLPFCWPFLVMNPPGDEDYLNALLCAVLMLKAETCTQSGFEHTYEFYCVRCLILLN